MSAFVYLDHAATTPLAPEVASAMAPYLAAEFGNPSARHPLGVRAAQALDLARAQLARALLVPAAQVVFTSGGTEAANLAVLGLARASRPRHVLVGATEHACVRACTAQLAREGFEVERIALAADGGVDLDAFARQLRPETALVAHMAVNNEFGTIAPLARMSKLMRARAKEARLVVDAVQALGKLDCAASELGWDALIVSAHKLGGPKGAGACVFARELAVQAIAFGGGQEHGLRPGTENVPAIVGFGAAVERAEAARARNLTHVARLRARMLEHLRALPGLRVIAPGEAVLPHILAFSALGAPAEVVLHHLEQRGVYVSTGSACQTLSKSLSPGLSAIGLGEDEIRRVLRVSFGAETSTEDVDAAARALLDVAHELSGQVS